MSSNPNRSRRRAYLGGWETELADEAKRVAAAQEARANAIGRGGSWTPHHADTLQWQQPSYAVTKPGLVPVMVAEIQRGRMRGPRVANISVSPGVPSPMPPRIED
ncbi:MAG: hypothetical protein ABI548_25345 [Polyangiaceae bacterium]